MPICDKQNGFTYLSLLIFMAILAMLSATVLHTGAAMQRRLAERELLEAGLRWSAALESYALSGGGGDAAPQSTKDLLRDPRFPQKPLRHLKRIEVDPITGSEEWGIVRGANGKDIVGFYSLSEDKPQQTTDFPEAIDEFNGKARYKDWVFVKGMSGN
jgi:type II secretory pathway pseudopilin PulG